MTRAPALLLLLAACPARPTTGPASGAGARPARLEGRLPDWNGDGYADLAVSAPGTQVEEIGRVFIYHGGPGGLSPSPATTLSGPDVVGAFFGASLAALGDLDGDGFADLAVGAPGADTFTGRVYVFRGSANGLITEPAWTLTGEAAHGWFGQTLAGAGDVDHDGFADLAVAAPGRGGGAVYLYRGSAGGPRAPAGAIYRGGEDGARLGAALAIAGDVNGDRFADVLAGAPGAAAEAGAAFVYAGAGADALSLTPAATLAGPPRLGQQWGASVALADLNADGFADALLGAPAAGAVHVHLGARAGVPAASSLTIAGPDAASAQFGAALVACGDVDGDAVADFAASAPASQQWTGRVHFYRGLDERPARSFDGPAGTHASFGASLACGGDTDGDDHPELIVGAPGARKLYVYRGDLDGPASEPMLVIAAPAGSPGAFGAALATTTSR